MWVWRPKINFYRLQTKHTLSKPRQPDIKAQRLHVEFLCKLQKWFHCDLQINVESLRCFYIPFPILCQSFVSFSFRIAGIQLKIKNWNKRLAEDGKRMVHLWKGKEGRKKMDEESLEIDSVLFRPTFSPMGLSLWRRAPFRFTAFTFDWWVVAVLRLNDQSNSCETKDKDKLSFSFMAISMPIIWSQRIETHGNGHEGKVKKPWSRTRTRHTNLSASSLKDLFPWRVCVRDRFRRVALCFYWIPVSRYR